MTPVLLAFIAIAAQGDATLFERPDPQLEAGARALSNRNYDAAIDHYRKAKAKTTAERAIVEYNVGIAALRKAQDLQVEAAAKKEQVAKGAKDDATLDEATALTPDFEVAAEALERAFQLADDVEVRSQAALGKGNAFALQKKLKKAVDSYRQALVQNPKNLAARQNLRRTLVRMRAKKSPPQEGEGDESDDSGEGGSEEGEDGEKKSSNESGDNDGEEKDKQEKKEQQDSDDEGEKEDKEKESDDDKEGQQEEGDDGAGADGEDEKSDDDEGDDDEDKSTDGEGDEQDEQDKKDKDGSGDEDEGKKPGDDDESNDDKSKDDKSKDDKSKDDESNDDKSNDDKSKDPSKKKSKEEKLKEEAEKKKEADKKKQEADNPNEKKGSKAKDESKSPPKPGAQAKPKESPKKRRARALLDAMRRREKPLGSVMMPQQARPRRKVEKDW